MQILRKNWTKFSFFGETSLLSDWLEVLTRTSSIWTRDWKVETEKLKKEKIKTSLDAYLLQSDSETEMQSLEPPKFSD